MMRRITPDSMDAQKNSQEQSLGRKFCRAVNSGSLPTSGMDPDLIHKMRLVIIKMETYLAYFTQKNDEFSLKVLVQLLVIISLANFFALSMSSLLGWPRLTKINLPLQ
jgi:hypothetical protein